MVEMVPEGGHGRGRANVGGAFLQIREADPQEDLVSDASFDAVGGLCLETWTYWRYSLSAEMKRTIRSRKGRDGNRLSINVPELLGMVMSLRDDSDQEGQASERKGVGADEGEQFVRGAEDNYLRGAQERGEIGRDDEDHEDVAGRGVELPSKARVRRVERTGRWDNEVERR